uniref:DUF834 domain-containing protein n=1 Tax=Oryza meridionalis TaxID=40149 RepID=A0A0E0C2Q4_9ORYZ
MVDAGEKNAVDRRGGARAWHPPIHPQPHRHHGLPPHQRRPQRQKSEPGEDGDCPAEFAPLAKSMQGRGGRGRRKGGGDGCHVDEMAHGGRDGRVKGEAHDVPLTTAAVDDNDGGGGIVGAMTSRRPQRWSRVEQRDAALMTTTEAMASLA